MTTEELYQQMRRTFTEQTGQPLEGGCDLAVRLYAAAAQLETLYQYADWSRRQAFPQTADGEYLDRHGQMRALERKQPSRAHGAVRVGLSQAQTEALQFTAGSILLAADDVSFTLDQDYTLTAGAMWFIAGVTAVETGSSGNLPAGSLLRFAERVACVRSVTAFDAFTGGRDLETDEDFRERILESFRPGANGSNAAWYREMALRVDGIAACSVLPAYRGALTLDVVPADKDGLPSQDQLNTLSQLLDPRRELGIDVQVRAPRAVTLNAAVTLRCADGVSFSQAEDAVNTALSGCFTGKLLGRPIYETALSHLVFTTGKVKDCTVCLSPSGENIQTDELPVLGQVSVQEAV